LPPGLICAGLLFILCAYFMGRIYAFQGQIRIPTGGSESVAVCAPGASGWSPGLLQGVPVSAIPFEHPPSPTLLAPDTLLDAVQLPFRLRLEGVRVEETAPARHAVQVEQEGTVSRRAVAVEETVTIGGASFVVGALRPWAGLVASGQGTALALLALQEDDLAWRENLVLGAGRLEGVTPEVAVRVMWPDGKTEAALPEVLDISEGARWGIEDAGRVQWIQSLAPGGGATLADGTEVELRAVLPDEHGVPMLRVDRKHEDKVEGFLVPANVSGFIRGVRLECPAARPLVVFVRVRDEQHVEVTTYESLRRQDVRELGPGETMLLGYQAQVRFRVDKLLANASVVETPQAGIWELVLEGAHAVVRVREEEVVTVAGARVQYVREVSPPRVSAQLRVQGTGGGDMREVTVAEQGELEIGGWRISIAEANAAPEQELVFDVRRVRGGLTWWLGGLFLGAGLVGWVWTRAVARRR
jgi:hypothetical protein